MASIKLKKNETFYIREGWFEKSINTIKEQNTNIFYKNEGIGYLGVGSNMVKSLKYWLKAANIIEGLNNNLTEFGELLYINDRYLDDVFSWFFIHYFLTANKDESPLANEIFNSSIQTFDKIGMIEYLMKQFSHEDKKVNKKYVESDLNVFIKSYINEDLYANPEDNYICPLSRLKLLKKEKDIYRKTKPAYSTLSYLIVYYSLCQIYKGSSFEIEDSMNLPNSPVKIFNLDKYMYLQYLDDAKRNELITINRTAGLNTVYFEKELSLKDIFREKFGSDE